VVAETELRLRHLEDVQAIITRLSQNSFVIRGWSVTLVSVVFAIISTRAHGSQALLLIALMPALIFWGLDAYYLRQERMFRKLYTAVAHRLTAGAAAPEVSPFDMDASRYADEVAGFFATLFAGHVLAIPAMLSVLALGYTVLSV
jgi:hypothetical protein